MRSLLRAGGSRTSGSESSVDRRYEEREARVSSFWERRAESGQRLRFFLRHPRLTARAVADVQALRRVPAILSDSVEGLALRSYLRRRVLGLLSLATIGACVLPVPADPAEYSEGRHRQTLRRKARAAERAGVTCRRVDDPGERRALVRLLDEVLPTKSDQRYRQHGTDHSFLLHRALWTAAYDGDGRPLVVAVTPFDGEWAVLEAFISLGETRQNSDARYLLTRAVVEQLSVVGVRYLVDTASPYELTNGLRHFQRMVGFRIARGRVIETSGRRLPAPQPAWRVRLRGPVLPVLAWATCLLALESCWAGGV